MVVDADSSPAAPRIGLAGWLRVVVRVTTLLLTLLAYVPLHFLWKLAGRRSPWPSRFLGRVARVAGARVRVTGVPLRHHVLALANHISWIDILALGGASGTAFVAKSELRDAPLVGWLAGLNNTLYVSRANRLGVTEQIAALSRVLAGPQPVTIFPEGTTGDGRSIAPFKASLLAVLDTVLPDVRVQPVYLDYGYATSELVWLGDEGGVANALRILARRGSFVLTLHFLDAFDPSDHPGRKAIALESHRRVSAAHTSAMAHA